MSDHTKTYRFIELGEEVDPVSQVLQQTTLFPVGKFDLGNSQSYFVQAQSEGSRAELFWRGIPQDEHTLRLRDAILNMVDMIVRTYDDPEITAFYAKGRGIKHSHHLSLFSHLLTIVHIRVYLATNKKGDPCESPFETCDKSGI